jgi:hypothetical protein
MPTEDKKYPIWGFAMMWYQDDAKEDTPPAWKRDLAPGRMCNMMQVDWMLRPGETVEERLAFYHTIWWPNYCARKLDGLNPGRLIVTPSFKHEETWCLDWFSHYTIDAGQTDREALDSFAAYVDRCMARNERERTFDERGFEKIPIQLMGAEDRWRWCGHPEPRTDPPCRCEGCKENGVIRICH